MPAYVVIVREGPIHTPSEMEEYQRKGAKNGVDPNLLPLAIYGAQTPLEGNPPDGVVVLQFPTVEDAKAWYFSEGYQDASKHRRAAAPYWGVIVEGFEMPK